MSKENTNPKERWAELAEQGLREPDQQRLFGRFQEAGEDGFVIDPIGFKGSGDAQDPGPVGGGDRRRATQASVGVSGWELRQRYEPTGRTLPELQRLVLEDLEGGISEVELVLGQDFLDSLAELDAVLQPVQLELVTTALRGGPAFFEFALGFLAYARMRGVEQPALRLECGADPLGVLLERGALFGSLEDALDDLSALAGFLDAHYENARAARVSAVPVSMAGANDAQQLGYLLASAVHTVRSLVARGFSPEAALGQLTLEVPVGSNVFAGVAKLRALRAGFTRLFQTEPPPICAVTAVREFSRLDPETNMLRVTSSAVASALGGADSVLADPWDRSPGRCASAAAHRLARNTQLILMEECQLHQVTDPLGGAWWLEQRTERLAKAAWQEMQQIEAAGGLAQLVVSGSYGERIESVAAAREDALRSGARTLVGVTKFAPGAEKDASTHAAVPAPGETPRSAPGEESRVEAAGSAEVADLVSALRAAPRSSLSHFAKERCQSRTPLKVKPLVVRPFAAPFETESQ